MFRYISWKWKNSRRWERRNILWTALFIITLPLHSMLLSVIAGGLLIVDAIFSACVDSYYNYKRSINSSVSWKRRDM